MPKSMEIPDCFYPRPPTTIPPSAPTPNHSLYLSNLDNQKFLRFSIKYLYIFKQSVNLDALKSSLSRVLVDYYPLAGRLTRTSIEDDHKLEVDCNGQGALFVEAFLDSSVEELLESSKVPNKSWRKLLYKVEAHSFLDDVPPLVIQVTSLRCGGMILCTAINHCLCDGIGTSQFLHAWAHLTKNLNIYSTILPFHERLVFKSRNPPQVMFTHPGYTRTKPTIELLKSMQSQPLVATSFMFGPSEVHLLKKQCIPLLKRTTTFEIVAAHTWRSWVRSLNLGPTLTVKLLFSVNIRKKVNLPKGYYGNGFVLACVESTVKNLLAPNSFSHSVKLVQEAKSCLDEEEYIKSIVDLLEDKSVKTDLSTSLVISQWSRLGLEEVDFGEGKPLHMGPLASDVYCLFLPVVGDFEAVRVLVSVPESVVERFQDYMMMKGSWEKDENGDLNTNGYHVEENSLI